MRGLRVLDGPPTCDAHRALAAAGSSILHVAVIAAIAVLGSTALPGGQPLPLGFDVILVADPGPGPAAAAEPGEIRETPGEVDLALVAAVAAPPPRSDPEPVVPPAELVEPDDVPEEAGEPALMPAAMPAAAPVESPELVPEIDLGPLVAEAPIADPAPRPLPRAEERLLPAVEERQALPRPPVKPRRRPVPALASLKSDLEISRPDPRLAEAPPRGPEADPGAAQTQADPGAAQTHQADPGAAQTQADPGAARAQDGLALVTDPRFRRTPRAPVYPQRAVELDQQGVVLVRALVREDGSAERAIVWRSSGFPLLDAAAAAAVRGWEFEPLRLAGMPQAAWVQIPVKFSLKE